MRFTIEHIGLTLPDAHLAPTVEFYERVLGLSRLGPASPAPGGSIWLSDGQVALEFRAGGDVADIPLSRPNHLAFGVRPDEFDAAHAGLAAGGAQVAPAQALLAGGWTTFFADPAGNYCQLVGRTSPL
jgi:catechol 2,3-dioxygenase-like lactoylglutathione lyase family enzyme